MKIISHVLGKRTVETEPEGDGTFAVNNDSLYPRASERSMPALSHH